MILSHYSDEPLELDVDRTYDHENDHVGYMKPSGLWVSIDGEYDWPEWCNDEGYYLEGLTHRTQFQLTPDAHVLILTTIEQLHAFGNEYLVPVSWSTTRMQPDWARVASRYDGIIITPYQRRTRLDFDTFWYYGWDCASGCIWNLHALQPIADTEALAS